MAKKKLVLSADQMEALANPLRAKVIYALRAYGPGSVTEISERISVDPKSLYYPIKKLLDVELIKVTGTKKGKRKSESVYSSQPGRFELSRKPDLELRAKLLRSTIRAAEAEFLAAQRAAEENSKGADAMIVIRGHLWFSESDRIEFIQKLNQLVDEYSSQSKVGQGELIHVTLLVAPNV